jgi:ABC-2 type transport system permease protein
MSNLALALRQFRYENRSFWRNPAAAFFTFMFPLMFMVIFNLLFDDTYRGRGIPKSASTFFTPAIITLSVVSACFMNIAMGVVFAREQGVLKRVRGTPLPGWAYLAGRILNSLFITVLLVVIVAAFGAVFYDVELPTRTLPAFVVSVLAGAAALTAVGLAATTIVPNADAAPPVLNGIQLPILFISNVFVPIDHAPRWLHWISNLFPVRHLSNLLLTAFIPRGGETGFVLEDLAMLAAWAVFGVVVAMRTFRWEPKA